MRAPLRRRSTALLLCLGLLAAGCTSDGSDGGEDDGATTTTAAGGPDVTVLGEEGDHEATIRRTEGGVPHITAATLADVSFGQGWASGEDRTCDLADQVLKVEGERARWLGAGDDDANITSDVAWRAIGIAEVAAKDWTEASDEVVELITAYTEGWNAHLAEVGAEELGEWCAGEPWVRALEPVQVYTYARSIALQASSGAVADMLPTAQPPAATKPAGLRGEAPTPAAEPTPTSIPAIEPVTASNGWAVGADRSTSGGGMLVGNPHFPWEGELRFWEVHLTVPGEVDIYGVQLSGLPGVGIGFTEEFGWTHTVSAGNRFTAYRLELEPGSPTTYRYGDETREITATETTIEVLGDDGEITEETHELWRSHYGPMLDFPGYAWSDTTAVTFRDGNIDDDEFVDQYLQMMQADDLDAFIDVHREVSGVPLFNTIATSADGRAWYGDTATVPKLSDEAIAAYEASLTADPIVGLAADAGAVLLDGSDPLFEWEEVPGARDPGLVPFAEMPVQERTDYLFNANDSFWLAHAQEPLDGDYSPLHGRQGTARSPRTRENAVVLDDASPEGASGEDGTFTLDELADASLLNRGYTASALREEVVARCTDAPSVAVGAVTDDDGDELLPASTVGIREACRVLAGWDGIYDLDRSGPVVWRELMAQFSADDLTEAGALWAEPFDADDPVGTPRGLAPAPATGPDPVLVNLARAVQVLEAADVAVDVPLGDVQVADRNGTLVPIQGGNSRDGTTNVVGWGEGWTILDPALDVTRAPVAGTGLARFTDAPAPDGDGEEVDPGEPSAAQYRVNNGTSFLFALAYGPEGPQAKAFLTYSDTADRDAEDYTAATDAFANKVWRDVAFTEGAVAAGTLSAERVRG